QFRVRWRLTARSEIAGGADEARTEMMEPHAIDEDPCRERIDRIHQRTRQVRPAAALLQWTRIDRLDETPRHDGPRTIWIPTLEDPRRIGDRQVRQDHGPRRRFGPVDQPLFKILEQRLELALARTIRKQRQESPVHLEWHVRRGVRAIKN